MSTHISLSVKLLTAQTSPAGEVYDNTYKLICQAADGRAICQAADGRVDIYVLTYSPIAILTCRCVCVCVCVCVCQDTYSPIAMLT